MVHRICVPCWCLALCVIWQPAMAGNSYVLPDGISRAPAVALHCVTGSGTASPCGTSSEPIFVTPSSVAASSANQATEITTQQGISQGIGTPADPAYQTGSGSVIALMKGVYSWLSSGVTEVPAGGALASRTLSVQAGASTALFASNPSRHYFGFQAPQTGAVWINFIGGVAGPNLPDCAYFPAGAFYESGQFVNRGAVTVYSSVSITISAWEG